MLGLFVLLACHCFFGYVRKGKFKEFHAINVAAFVLTENKESVSILNCSAETLMSE